MRYLLTMFAIMLVSGCATHRERLPPELIHDYCTKDKILWFEHDATLDYLTQNEPVFLRDYVEHNDTYEAFCMLNKVK
jgi:hypothetical protein